MNLDKELKECLDKYFNHIKDENDRKTIEGFKILYRCADELKEEILKVKNMAETEVDKIEHIYNIKGQIIFLENILINYDNKNYNNMKNIIMCIDSNMSVSENYNEYVLHDIMLCMKKKIWSSIINFDTYNEKYKTNIILDNNITKIIEFQIMKIYKECQKGTYTHITSINEVYGCSNCVDKIINLLEV